MEVMFTVLSAFKFIENTIWEWTEALSTPKRKKLFRNLYVLSILLNSEEKKMKKIILTQSTVCATILHWS